MKRFNLKSMVVGLAIGVAVAASIGAATNASPQAWEYKMVFAQGHFSNLEKGLSENGKNGWEAVSASDNAGQPWVLMKRALK